MNDIKTNTNKLQVPHFIERHLPTTPEGLRKLDEKMQENATYVANTGAALFNIPVQLALHKGNFEKALQPILMVGSYDLASILIQGLSWKVGAKYLQPMFTKFIGASSEYNESVKGIISKLISLVFWVGIFPVVNSCFDEIIKKIYHKIIGKEEPNSQTKQTEHSDHFKTIATIIASIGGAAGLTFLLRKPLKGLIQKLITKVDLKKMNQLLLDCEQFVFIPLCGLMRLFVEHFMNHKNWSKAFDDTLPFLMIQSANFVSQIGVVASKKAIVNKLGKFTLTNKAGQKLAVNKAMTKEPTSVQNIAFSIICGVKDFFIPVIGLFATGAAESFFGKNKNFNSAAV